MTELSKVTPKSFWYPPGGILIWLIIVVELFTFGMALSGLSYYAAQAPEAFHEARLGLSMKAGLLNTIVLLFSGFLMALAMQAFRTGRFKLAAYFSWATLAVGAIFVTIKVWEYSQKIGVTIMPDHELFYTFYRLMTGFHLIHVLVGMVIIGWNIFEMRRFRLGIDGMAAGAAFWHMCDLIWLMLFPVLYLIF